jgi:NADH-quinone oxidoreductase subunit G
LKSAQARLEERFGLRLAGVPAGGIIQSLGKRFEAPTELPHIPQLWKPRMHPHPERRGSGVPGREERAGLWELPMHDASLPTTPVQPGGDD